MVTAGSLETWVICFADLRFFQVLQEQSEDFHNGSAPWAVAGPDAVFTYNHSSISHTTVMEECWAMRHSSLVHGLFVSNEQCPNATGWKNIFTICVSVRSSRKYHWQWWLDEKRTLKCYTVKVPTQDSLCLPVKYLKNPCLQKLNHKSDQCIFTFYYATWGKPTNNVITEPENGQIRKWRLHNVM